MADETQQEATKLIDLSTVSQQTGIPLETLLSAVKATPQRMWAIKVKVAKRGRLVDVWHTAPIEVERFQRMWRKHQPVKNS